MSHTRKRMWLLKTMPRALRFVRLAASCVPVRWVFATVSIVTITIWMLPRPLAEDVIRENGIVETATVGLYLLATASMLPAKRGTSWRGRTGGAFLLLLFALRELDFNRRFTSGPLDHGVLYFVRHDVPDEEKILVGCVFVVLAGILIWVFRALYKPFVNAAKARKPYLLPVVAGLVIIPVSQVFDESGHLLKRLDEPLSNLGWLLNIIAEVLEMGLALLMLVSVLMFHRDHLEMRQRETTQKQ